MRYRALSADGDYQSGNTPPFFINSPAGVAQAIKTRLELFTNEWFLDKREGLDKDQILGFGTEGTRDRVIQQRIIGTQGVISLLSYTSNVDDRRRFTVQATVDTVYGQVTITQSF